MTRTRDQLTQEERQAIGESTGPSGPVADRYNIPKHFVYQMRYERKRKIMRRRGVVPQKKSKVGYGGSIGKLSEEDKQRILRAGGKDQPSVIAVAADLGITENAAYRFRSGMAKNNSAVVAKSKSSKRNLRAVSGTQAGLGSDSFQVKVGSVAVDVVSESNAKVSGISVEEKSIIINIK